MVILLPAVEYWIMVPKILDFLLSFIIAIKVLRLRPDYILNRIYCVALLAWSGYMLGDVVIWVSAPYSEFLYDLGNLLRDLQMICVISMGFLIYNSQKIINQGASTIINLRFFLEAILFLTVMVWLVIIDGVDVLDASGNVVPKDQLPLNEPGFHAAPRITAMTAILSIFPIAFYVYALLSQSWIIRTKIKEPELKRRMIRLTLGLACIPVGIIYFIVQTIFGWYNFAVIFFGYVPWTLAPFLILSSQQNSKNSNK